MDTSVIVTFVLGFVVQIASLGVAVAVLRNDISWLKDEVTTLKHGQDNSVKGCTERDIKSSADTVTLETLSKTVEEVRKECRENNFRLTRIEAKLNGK